MGKEGLPILSSTSTIYTYGRGKAEAKSKSGKEVSPLGKRWPFTLAYFIVGFVGITLVSFGPSYGLSKYVGLGILVLAISTNLFPHRPRKTRLLPASAFFVLGETGFFLSAFWQSGMAPFISIS
jgi:hypothetical protein